MSETVPTTPTASSPLPDSDPHEAPLLAGPDELVDEYLRLVEERRALDERLSYVRAELELVAASALSDASPRGRFVGARGAIAARLAPTCVFDRAGVARELQRMGKLAEVAILQGPGLARYLAKEPVVAARISDMVRMRRSVVLVATP